MIWSYTLLPKAQTCKTLLTSTVLTCLDSATRLSKICLRSDRPQISQPILRRVWPASSTVQFRYFEIFSRRVYLIGSMKFLLRQATRFTTYPRIKAACHQYLHRLDCYDLGQYTHRSSSTLLVISHTITGMEFHLT